MTDSIGGENMNRSLDLETATMPQEVADILWLAAEKYNESATELTSAWQDKGAGKPWEMIAKELGRCADRIKKKLLST